ncbi:MAG: bifunctional DNA-formamidopyrimidine glycosylase/DNA-(apurinic or apyrimidinic site) lyase [Symbiobacteriia bacterium]
MPELPEVETVRRSLVAGLVGRRIVAAQVSLPRVIRYPEVAAFLTRVTDRRITGLGRRAKYLLIHLDSGDDLMVHLRMTGRLLLQRPAEPVESHTHVILTLDDSHQLRFQDARTFGGFYLLGSDLAGAPPGFLRLGAEPLTAAFTRGYLRKTLQGRKGRVKSLLLNQDLIGGLGNIYADEALFRSGIHPACTGASLTAPAVSRLHAAINQVIAESLALGGTTFYSYVDGQGNRGQNVENLRVYGREGEPCLVCGARIERIVLGGRSSHYCPSCQKRRGTQRQRNKRREQ